MDRDALVTVESDTAMARRCICTQPSTRNLLGLRREAVHQPGTRAAGAQIPFTLRVVAVRVEFPLESPDDPTTTGNGRFDLRDTAAYREANAHNFDSAPHNKRYFETHLRALNLYWNTVSNGEVTLDYTVFPFESDSAYQMPHEMAYYGRERDGDSGVIFGLEQFVIDAATVASADPAVQFTDYDAVVFFHPGADRQGDFLEDTPNNLFTGFVKLGQFTSLSAGVNDQISEAIIMPETVIQDGRITVLNAVFAHEFGHQLGLVDLYSTRSFLTQVGNFSLMDNNVADVGVDVEVEGRRRIMFGALPVFPDAWSRLYLGFVTANEVFRGSGILVPEAEGFNPPFPQTVPQVIKIPISSTEYYLVEHRRFDIDGRGDAGLRLDSVTNVVLEPVDTISVFANREYDFLLPGNGLLIWHVDEGVAALDYVTEDDIPNNFQANTLQWDHARRFVRLVEADGLVNFGGFYSAGTGTSRDYFYDPNNVDLSSETNPPLISNTGGRTNIRIHNISAPLIPMEIDVDRVGYLNNFPVYAGQERGGTGAPVVVDLTPGPANQWRYPGDGHPEVYLGYKHYIMGWDRLANPIRGVATADTTRDFDTAMVTRTIRPLAMGIEGEEWLCPPLLADIGDQIGVLAAVSNTGRVFVWNTNDVDGNGLFDLRFSGETFATPTGPPMIWNRSAVTRELVIPTGGGQIETFGLIEGDHDLTETLEGPVRSLAGLNRTTNTVVVQGDEWMVGSYVLNGRRVELSHSPLLAPAMGDLDRDSVLDVIVVNADGQLWALDTLLLPLPGFPVDLGITPSAAPSLADIDADGYLDILVSGDGLLVAVARNGVLLPNFPVTLGERSAPDSLAHQPVIGDLDMGGTLTAMTAGARRTVFGVDGNGSLNESFTLPLGDTAFSAVAWAPNPDLGSSVLFARSHDGYLYAYELPGGDDPVTALWPMAAHDSRRTSVIPVDDLGPVETPGDFFVSERAFVYPNPANGHAIVRYWLGETADVTIRIYDLAGDLVVEAAGPGSGGLYNEWTWDCSNAASGVYFAHIEAHGTDNGRRETVLCKMAVVQ